MSLKTYRSESKNLRRNTGRIIWIRDNLIYLDDDAQQRTDEENIEQAGDGNESPLATRYSGTAPAVNRRGFHFDRQLRSCTPAYRISHQTTECSAWSRVDLDMVHKGGKDRQEIESNQQAHRKKNAPATTTRAEECGLY
jgi:hypothetical protein